MKADGEPVKNKEELIVLDKAMDGIAVKWVSIDIPHVTAFSSSFFVSVFVLLFLSPFF